MADLGAIGINVDDTYVTENSVLAAVNAAMVARGDAQGVDEHDLGGVPKTFVTTGVPIDG